MNENFKEESLNTISKMDVSIFNGAGQPDYLYGLVTGLLSSPAKKIEILDIDLAAHLFEKFEKVNFHKVYRYQKQGSSILRRGWNILTFYFLQSRHILIKSPRIIHFQWLDRYFFTDRIILPMLARLRGHKVILTVHNVNAGKRDKRDSYYNRFTLYMLYHLCNHLIVHTDKSKKELINEFNIVALKISVVKHGMNNKVENRGINQTQARTQLKINQNDKVVLFFGNIDFYKGLDLLVDSLNYLSPSLKKEIILLIAGNYKSIEYVTKIYRLLEESQLKSRINAHIKFIRDQDIELFFAAADCIVLPYRDIYQSGVLFMAYNFGLPSIATRVGNFEHDIESNKTGFLIDSIDPISVAISVDNYFKSELYKNLFKTRQYIRDWSYKEFSWESIGKETYEIYQKTFN